MLSPLDLFKSYFNFKSYYSWFFLAIFFLSVLRFFKKKDFYTHHPRKGYLIYFLIILGFFGFVYFSFFHKSKEPASKYVGQLINEYDKALNKCDQIINNYQGLKSDWEGELKKCEEELKTLYEKQELNQKQKTKIKKLLEQTELKITDIKIKQQKIEKNIGVLKEKEKQKEQSKTENKKEIDRKKEELKQTSPDDKIRLRAEIKQLQDEVVEFVRQISEIKIEIAKLKSQEKMYTDMLSNANKLKDSLQRDFDHLTSNEKTLFNQVESIRDRQVEIKKNIDEINKKIEEIKMEQVLYRDLKIKYCEMHGRLVTYEKENELSFGNFFKFVFKATDKIADFMPATFGIKTIGKTMSVTRKFAQGMGKATLILHEGHRLWHMYNEVANENKESPLMITKETLESYLNDIKRDTDKLDTDLKDYENKLEMYKKKNLRQEMQDEKNQLSGYKEQERSKIASYSRLINQLEEGMLCNMNIEEFKQKLEYREEDLSLKRVEINERKEELKEKCPNYARVQQNLEEKRRPKIPNMEIIMIPNQ